MNTGLRRMRGVLGMSLTWAAAWYAVFALLTVVVWIVRPQEVDAGEGPIRVGAIMAGVGLVSGAVFAILLHAAERGHAVAELSLRRAALWGALASAVFPVATGRADAAVVFCPVGAVLAVGLALAARHAERRDASGVPRGAAGSRR
jgi:hypothetical protein